MLTNVLKPQQTQPRDLSQRLLQRLYPGDFGAAAPAPPKSPTGLPISQPPPPAPVAGRMAQPGAQTQGAIPSYGGQPQAPAMQPQGGAGSVVGAIRGAIPTSKPPDPYGDMPWDQQVALKNYFDSLAGIDYKGSHESAQIQQAALAQLLRGWNMEGPIDYTSAAPMADQFDRSRNQLEASLAARGLSGGVVGGALSNSYSQEARGIGDYIRQLTQQREEQRHNDYQRFLDWARQLQAMGLGKNIDEQNSGGFWDALAGVGGSLVGGLIP